jgi:hypothetical protein
MSLIEQQEAGVALALSRAPWKKAGRVGTLQELDELCVRHPIVREYFWNLEELRVLRRSWPQKRIAHEYGVSERTIRNVIAHRGYPSADASRQTAPQVKKKNPRGRPRKWTREKYLELLNGRGNKPKSLRQRMADARKALSEKCAE